MSPDAPQLPVTSSVEPEWASEARECYRGVIRALEQDGIPFVVGGGFAFHRHTGIWRATKDLDLFLVADAVPRALEELGRRGFEVYIEDPIWLAKARRNGYYVDLITGVGNATLCVDQSWMNSSVEDRVLDIPCKILGAEEMIASKTFVTRRERFDGADIAHLMKARGHQLDWDRLLALLEPYWQMLYWHLQLFAFIYPAHISLVPQRLWNELGRRFAEVFRFGSQEGTFRGSLIDPKMFAIDVKEWGEPDLYTQLAAAYPHRMFGHNAAGSEK